MSLLGYISNFASPSARYEQLQWDKPAAPVKLGCCESSKTRSIATGFFATIGLSSFATGAYLATQTIVVLTTLHALAAVSAISLVFALICKLAPPSFNDPVNVKAALEKIKEMVDKNVPYSQIAKAYPLDKLLSPEMKHAILAKKIAGYTNYQNFINVEGVTDADLQPDALNKGFLHALHYPNANHVEGIDNAVTIQAFIYHCNIGLVKMQERHGDNLLQQLSVEQGKALTDAIITRELNKVKDGSKPLMTFIQENGRAAIDTAVNIDKAALSLAFKNLSTDQMLTEQPLAVTLLGNAFTQTLNAYTQSITEIEQDIQQKRLQARQTYNQKVAALDGQQEIAKLDQQIQSLTAQHQDALATYNQLAKALQDATFESTQLQAMLKTNPETALSKMNVEELTRHIQSLESQIQATQVQIPQAQDKLLETQKRLANIEQEWNSRVKKLEGTIKKQTEDHLHLKIQHDTACANFEHTQKKLQEQIKELTQKQEQEQSNNGLIKSGLSAIQSVFILSPLEEAEIEKKALETNKKTLEEQYTKLETSLRANEKELIKLKPPETLQHWKDTLSTNIATETAALTALKDELLKHQAALGAATTRKTAVESISGKLTENTLLIAKLKEQCSLSYQQEQQLSLKISLLNQGKSQIYFDKIHQPLIPIREECTATETALSKEEPERKAQAKQRFYEAVQQIAV